MVAYLAAKMLEQIDTLLYLRTCNRRGVSRLRPFCFPSSDPHLTMHLPNRTPPYAFEGMPYNFNQRSVSYHSFRVAVSVAVGLSVQLAIQHPLPLLITGAVNGAFSNGTEGLAVDLLLDAVSSIPASLLGNLDVAGPSSTARLRAQSSLLASLQVAGNEERDEEVGQGSQVENVEPGGESRAARRDAVSTPVLGLGKAGRLRLDLNGNSIRDERVDRCHAATN